MGHIFGLTTWQPCPWVWRRRPSCKFYDFGDYPSPTLTPCLSPLHSPLPGALMKLFFKKTVFNAGCIFMGIKRKSILSPIPFRSRPCLLLPPPPSDLPNMRDFLFSQDFSESDRNFLFRLHFWPLHLCLWKTLLHANELKFIMYEIQYTFKFIY